MVTKSFAGIDLEVQPDGTVRLSLETSEVDLSIYMSNDEFMMFMVGCSNTLWESKRATKKARQAVELLREKRR